MEEMVLVISDKVKFEFKKIKVRIVGDSPLIVHANLARMNGSGFPKVREKKNIFKEFVDSMYWLDEKPNKYDKDTVLEAAKKSRFGIPSVAVKRAAFKAAKLNDVDFRTIESAARACFEILPDCDDTIALTQISFDKVVMRGNKVKIGTDQKRKVIRYRGQYEGWSAVLTIKYLVNEWVSIDQFIDLINAGGSAVGIGEWRPEIGGPFGKFHVEAVE